jgi:hypothetical protein
MIEFGLTNNPKTMRIFLYLFFLFITTSTYSQKLSKKDFSRNGAINFLLDDSKILWRKHFPEIINEGKEFGYLIYREDDKFIFDTNIYGLNYKLLILEKDIYDYNYEFFPGYSIGKITKYYFFYVSQKDPRPIEEALPQLIETKISLLEYSNVSRRAIDRYFSFLDNYYKDTYIDNFKTSSAKQVYMQSVPSYNKTNFSVLKQNDIKTSWTNYSTNPDTYGEPFEIEHKVKVNYGADYEEVKMENGEYFTYGIYGISYCDESWYLMMDTGKKFSQLNQNTKKGLDELKYFINDIDIREISMYDLTSMVSIFLDDCAEFNIPVPNINTLKATFEPLEGNTIALAYGMNLDDKIVIKVDPTKWQEASVQKKWYILYHELGHDVLNLEHGEAGKMMFNFAEREYTWEEFFEDKEYMFKAFKKNN